MQRIHFTRGCWLAIVVGGISTVVLAAGSTVPPAPGEVIVGNGFPDGLGAALARIFVRVTNPRTDGAQETPLELYLTSKLVTVDPVRCSQPSKQPCRAPGKGIAGVAGNPTSVVGPVMGLKLASALYVRSGPLRGHSVEVAFEGGLYASPESAAGDPAELRLFLAHPGKLIQWAADTVDEPAERSYRANTGAGLVLGDSQVLLFPGWLKGRVLENDGAAILIELTEAEIFPAMVTSEKRVWLRPDPEAARELGFPAGVFGRLQVNYSGFPSPSAIVDGASTNDVEVHVLAAEPEAVFLRGDCDGDGSARGVVTDALALLKYNFWDGTPPPCIAACDSDGNGRVAGTVVDAVYLLSFHFQGGPPPPPPYPDCGRDPGAADLDCEIPPPCP